MSKQEQFYGELIRYQITVANWKFTQVQQCQDKQNNQTKRTSPDQCIGSDIHFNSILAFDMSSGRIRWSRQLRGYGVFYFAFLDSNNKDCPTGPTLDADFAEFPMLLKIISYGRPCDVAIAVQKSGFVWALDCDNGDKVWFNVRGYGNNSFTFLVVGKTRRKGGRRDMECSLKREKCLQKYTNTKRVRFPLAPSSKTTTAGAWVALDTNSSEIIWSSENPSEDTSLGPVSVVNGVLFVGSVGSNGPLYAMDANNGAILWMNNTGAIIYVGVPTSYRCIYHGNGYTTGKDISATPSCTSALLLEKLNEIWPEDVARQHYISRVDP
ncbi:hypothetical protein LguiA_029983 [Lonicera macranthoides]